MSAVGRVTSPYARKQLPFICTSINPGLMIKPLRSICTSGLICSSQNIDRGSTIFLSRTQGSSTISELIQLGLRVVYFFLCCKTKDVDKHMLQAVVLDEYKLLISFLATGF